MNCGKYNVASFFLFSFSTLKTSREVKMERERLRQERLRDRRVAMSAASAEAARQEI